MKRFSWGSLRVSLILLVLLAVIPSLALILYTGWEERQISATDAQQDALQLVLLASADQDLLVESTRQFLMGLTRLPEVRQGDSAACSALLADLLKQYPLYTNIGVVEPSGEQRCSAVPASGPVNYADRPWFQDVMRTRDFVVGGYVIGRITRKPVAAFGYPVLDATGQVQVIVFVGLDLAWLNRFVAQTQLPAGSVLTVIDGNGIVLARTLEPEKWVGQAAAAVPIAQAILTRQSQGTVETIDMDGVNRLYAFTPLGSQPSGDVYVSIGIPSAVAFAQADQMLARNLAALGLVTVLALAAAWVGGDLFLLRRINVLLSATKRLAAGDLGTRTGISYGTGELSQLARAFDQMAQSLEQRVEERKQAEESLRESDARFRRLTENARDLIYRYEFNPKRGFTYVSPAATAITGYTPAEHYANPDLGFELVHPDDHPLLEQYFQGKGMFNQPLALRWVHKNGKIILALWELP